jgi:hypothetical protein
MPTISQILAVSYPAVIAKKPANQWAESALLRALEAAKAIKRTALGSTIDATLDYQANDGAKVLASDVDTTSTSKTDVLTAASYAVAAVSVPIIWSKQDEAMNDDAKAPFVTSLIDNALASHDDLIEQNILVGTQNFVGLNSMVTEDGTGTVGGIIAGTDIFWKNQFDEWNNSTDIVSVMTSVWNSCTKGTGSPMTPKVLVSDADTQAVFEATQGTNQRYVNTNELDAGFIVLAFKSAKYVFSQYGTDSIYFLNPKNYQIRVSKSMYRFKDKEVGSFDSETYKTSVFSALQAITDNRSRLGVAFT